MEALIEIGKEKGHAIELRDVVERVSIGNSTFYKYFASRIEAVQTLAQLIVGDIFDRSVHVMEIDDALEALEAWMKVGFYSVEQYGALAVELCYPDRLPEWLSPIETNEDVYRMTGALIRKAQEQHYCRETPIRPAVRTWFAMCHPGRMHACVRDGLSWEEARRETFDVFMMAYGKR